MTKQTKSNWQKQMVFVAIATAVFMFAASSLATAQDLNQTYTVGESIEVKWADTWLKAKIIEEKNGWYTIRYDVDGAENYVQKNRMRPLAGAKPPTISTAPGTATGKTAPTQPDKPKNEELDPNKYKPGDRVECDKAGIDFWQKGTVMPFQKNDFKTGILFRVRLDSFARNGMYLDGHECLVENIRPLGGAAYKNDATAVPVGKATVDDENTLSADRPIMTCPVEQTPVKNGARPNIELFKKIIRCRKGEKPASKGYDGAVTVDVTALQPGATRSWQYGRDLGGKPGTIIHPMKATFHYKTFYRSSTQVEQNWIRIINFFVNAFGEWETGSEESIKMGEIVNIPRDQ